MRKVPRKQEAMYAEFGKDGTHTCGQCSNFISGSYHGRILKKCKGYGLTHSEASDWARNWVACGMFSQPFAERRPMIERMCRKKNDNSPVEGQIGLEGL
jgi:hypothetical protein